MINKKLLKSGDILLFRETHRSTLFQRLIVWGQKTFYHVPSQARYCHVALVDKDTDYMLEAVWPKTRQSKIDFSTYKAKEIIEVYRVRGITDEQINKTLDWAHNNLGKWYNILDFLSGWLQIKHTYICSTFVSTAFKIVNLYIPYKVKNNELVIPDDYYQDSSLDFIC